ncbi:MAG TPA: hypothetical protein VIR59_14860 [Gaiellaceae bacterium]
MSRRRLEILQWTGLLAGGLVWAAQHVVGYGITEAACGAGSPQFGISNDVWQASLMAAAAVVILAAQAAAVTVLLATRSSSYETEPPPGRIRFFAIAAIVANTIFLMIVLLDGFASIFNVECRQS